MRLRVTALLVLSFGCKESGGEPNDAKLMPKAPPSPSIGIPRDLQIRIEIDGKPAGQIDASLLDRTPPTFMDPEHQAWRIADLIHGADDDDTLITVSGAGGIELSVERKEGQPEAVLMLTRRGDVVGALVSPQDPFPKYHGQGRRLNRGGDPLPHITRIERIRVDKPKHGPSSIEILSNGKVIDVWTVERLETVKMQPIASSSETAREGWSLRDLVTTLIGPKARAVAVSAQRSRRATFDLDHWRDLSRTPVLRFNRQGQFKFHWAGAGTRGTEELRNVRAIEVVLE